MENKKTISHLNGKAWYRLVKVVFFLALLIALGIFNLIAFSSKPYTTTDEYNSKIVCNNGKDYIAGNNGIDIYKAIADEFNRPRESSYILYDVIGTDHPNNATVLCWGGSSFVPEAISNDDWLTLTSSTPQYKVELAKKTVGNWWGFLELLVIGNIVILLIFEVIRRVFYYIVLGSIKPEK
jgi:hypothetical protein